MVLGSGIIVGMFLSLLIFKHKAIMQETQDIKIEMIRIKNMLNIALDAIKTRISLK
jgi:hypothetical protein